MATCDSCGHDNPEGAAFCAQCGTRLAAAEPAAEAPAEAPPATTPQPAFDPGATTVLPVGRPPDEPSAAPPVEQPAPEPPAPEESPPTAAPEPEAAESEPEPPVPAPPSFDPGTTTVLSVPGRPADEPSDDAPPAAPSPAEAPAADQQVTAESDGLPQPPSPLDEPVGFAAPAPPPGAPPGPPPGAPPGPPPGGFVPPPGAPVPAGPPPGAPGGPPHGGYGPPPGAPVAPPAGGFAPPPGAPVPAGPPPGAPGAPGGYAPPPVPGPAPVGAPVPGPAPAPAPADAGDPHGFVPAAGRLSNPARKSARIPATVAAALLHDGELVELMVVGRIQGLDAVAVLTNQRLLLVNDNALKPLVQGFEVDAELQVQGWEEGRAASLVLTRGQDAGRIDSIGDTGLAKEMAGRIRARTGADAPPPGGPAPG